MIKEKKRAIIITGGLFDKSNAKTAHGLIRVSNRFDIQAVIDERFSGQDAGTLLDGQHRGIPVFSSVKMFLQNSQESVQYCIVGIATKGGVIPQWLRTILAEALEMGLGIINGLHEFVTEIPEFVAIAEQKKLTIRDIRKPQPFKDLHFWSGEIQEVKCPKIAVLGTDCALGKRTTAMFLVAMMRRRGYRAEMIYTGQTGWLQGANYGFIFDATPNDFVSGELEHAIVCCFRERKPDIIFIEGQSSLQNPSGPCGAEILISADVQGAILQHHPNRKKFKGLENYHADIPEPDREIALIEAYGYEVLALTLNTHHLSCEEAKNYFSKYKKQLQIPVVLPIEQGVEDLFELLKPLIRIS